jgi:hypothetical protein
MTEGKRAGRTAAEFLETDQREFGPARVAL